MPRKAPNPPAPKRKPKPPPAPPYKTCAPETGARVYALFAIAANGKELLGIYSKENLVDTAKEKAWGRINSMSGFSGILIEETTLDNDRF